MTRRTSSRGLSSKDGLYRDSETRLITHGSLEQYKEYFLERMCAHVKAGYSHDKVITRYRACTDPVKKQELKHSIQEHLFSRCVMPDSAQVIHYDEWDDPSNFNMPSLQHLYHPHWRLAYDRLLDLYQQTSDMLLVMPCAGSKPYSANKGYVTYMAAAQQGVFDIMTSSLYPAPVYPLDASALYPYVVSNWPHDSSDRLNELSNDIHVQYMMEFLNWTSYKKVVYCHCGDKDISYISEQVSKHAPSGMEIIDLPRDRGMIDDLTSRFDYLRERKGLLQLRLPVLKATREYVALECRDPNAARRALKLDVKKTYQAL